VSKFACDKAKMRVAIIHDWFITLEGGKFLHPVSPALTCTRSFTRPIEFPV
jgi:hypothetical protein